MDTITEVKKELNYIAGHLTQCANYNREIGDYLKGHDGNNQERANRRFWCADALEHTAKEIRQRAEMYPDVSYDGQIVSVFQEGEK